MRIIINTRRARLPLTVVVILVALWLLYSLFLHRAHNQPLTVQDVYRLEAQALRNPHDFDATFRAAIAYAAFVREVGTLRRAVHSVSAIQPVGGENERIAALKQKLQTSWAQLLQKFGLRSEGEWAQVLRRSIAFNHLALQRAGTDPARRAALHLAMGQVLLQAERPSDAMEHVLLAERYGGDSIGIHLLKAEVLREQRRWSEAITVLRRASILVGAWAQQAPPWELRLMWALHRPSRRYIEERHWYKRRQEIANAVRHLIASEIMILQGLQRIEQRGAMRE